MGKQQPIAVDQMVVYTIPEKDRKRNNVVEDELVGKVLSVSGDTTLANSEVMIIIAKFQRTDRGSVAHECFDPLASYEGIKYKHGGEVTVEVSRTSVLYGLAFRKTGAPMTVLGKPRVVISCIWYFSPLQVCHMNSSVFVPRLAGVPGDLEYQKDAAFSKSNRGHRVGPLHPKNDFFRPRPSLFDSYKEEQQAASEAGNWG